MNEIWKQLPTDLYPKIFMFLEHPEARIIKDWVVNIPSKNRMQVEDKGVYGINIKGYKEAIGFYEWKYMQKRMYPKYMLTLSVMQKFLIGIYVGIMRMSIIVLGWVDMGWIIFGIFN